MKILISESQFNFVIEQFEKLKKEFQFSPENLAKEIVKQNIKYPDVVLAQAMLETGHFKSNIFKENNNLFGMKMPYSRTTTANGEKNKHAFYNTWIDSVKDYKLWQDHKKVGSFSKNQYLDMLRKSYCFPPECITKNYTSTVSSLLSRANKLLQNNKKQNIV